MGFPSPAFSQSPHQLFILKVYETFLYIIAYFHMSVDVFFLAIHPVWSPVLKRYSALTWAYPVCPNNGHVLKRLVDIAV